MAQTRRNLYKDLMVVFFLFLFSVGTNFIPGFDLVKSFVLAVVLSAFYVYQAKARTREEETDRYRRICAERYPVRLKKNAYHLSNILSGGDIPYAMLEWVGKLMGAEPAVAVECVKKECGGMLHTLDSFCRVYDLPAEGIARAMWFLATAKATGQRFENALEAFVSENVGALGQQISKGCFVKNLESGAILPYGIFQSTPSARLLVTFCMTEVAIEKLNIFGQKATEFNEINAMRLCLRCTLKPEEATKIVHEVFPEMAPKNLGSGPQHYGLYIQESVSVDKASAESRLPLLIEKLGLK